MSVITVDAIIVGRKWDLRESHSLMKIMEAQLLALPDAEISLRRWEVESPSEADLLWICPGFNLPGGKYVLATKRLLTEAKERNQKVVIWSHDMELLKAWNKFVSYLDLEHMLTTNFQKAYKYWGCGSCKAYIYNGFCPTGCIRLDMEREIKFPVGYVGWPKQARMAVVKSIGYSNIVMMGFGTHKQKEFPYIRSDFYVSYQYLQELYSLAAWHLTVSDKHMTALEAAPSRVAETWHCKRPCAFHVSMVESRPDVDWSKVQQYVFQGSAELHALTKIGRRADKTYDVSLLESIAAEQKAAIGHQFFAAHPNNGPIVDWVLNRGVYAQ